MLAPSVPDWRPEDPEAWKDEPTRKPSPVSVPIAASSDAVALFDLITDSGCRMPSELKP